MGVICGRGINYSDLITLVGLIITKFNATLVKLDADSLTLSDYNSTYSFTASTYTAPNAVHDQGQILTFFAALATNFNAVLARLDANGSGVGTNYVSLWGMGNYISNPLLGSMEPTGIYEGSLIKWLSDYLTKWNGVLAKLDADGGIAATDYVSGQGITAATYIDATGCSHRPVVDA